MITYTDVYIVLIIFSNNTAYIYMLIVDSMLLSDVK